MSQSRGKEKYPLLSSASSAKRLLGFIRQRVSNEADAGGYFTGCLVPVLRRRWIRNLSKQVSQLALLPSPRNKITDRLPQKRKPESLGKPARVRRGGRRVLTCPPSCWTTARTRKRSIFAIFSGRLCREALQELPEEQRSVFLFWNELGGSFL